MIAENKCTDVSCKLTPPELQQRKESMITRLRLQVTDKQELDNGYAFKFPGDDRTIDELVEFIKTERECCGFFTFSLSVSGDQSEAWLTLTGPAGAKEFIVAEMQL